MRFAVIACSACREPWAVETRHAKVACPRCGTSVLLADRARLWQGDTAAAAAQAAGDVRARQSGMPLGVLAPAKPAPRHDSVADAAAAQAQGIINKSRRAEAVADWMTRLAGQPSHAQLVEAMAKAGIEPPRAEREIQRMLAMDYITEPRAGTYRVLPA